ncbi:FAD-dependent oxidoreductase [Alphaproteobacteria bacterium]|nr:FAD-dependent oxidoreductase [Alphaproteobacteria bacterium]MDC1121457.1 FAD-dependent oxidoreductase [Alphaproteobacteria bacterium]
MTHHDFDICIIGGGSGGLSLAAGAAQLGAKIVLFEASKMGGDCLNSGCVPSKALLAAAKAAHYAKGAASMGIYGSAPKIDFAAVKAHLAAVIDGIAPHDSVERFESLGVTVICEHASFTGRREVASKNHTVRAKYFVIATGSQPAIPPIDGLADTDFHTNETIFVDPNKPYHLVIIGGGPIGIEMAQAHVRLGVQVTVVEALSIMARDDAELVARLKARLQADGVRFIEGIGVSKVRHIQNSIRLILSDGTRLMASHLLVATGRRPVTNGMNLHAAGVDVGKAGIVTDRRLRTSNKRIFAIGDVTGRQQFTHVAAYHAGICLRNILFKLPAKIDDSAVPWVTYCDPELAHVGLTYDDAVASWGADNVTVTSWDLADNDRARAELHSTGMVKATIHKNGQILGASILAPAAGEMIQPWILAIANRRKIYSLATMIAPYPTYGEASKRAAGNFFTAKLFSPRTQKLVRFLLKF